MTKNLTDNEMDTIAKKVLEKLPNARLFSAKMLAIIVGGLLTLAFSTGVLWTDIQNLPNITTKEWNKVVKYSVDDQPVRKDMYDEVITEFRMKDAEHDRLIVQHSEDIAELKATSKEVLSIVRKIYQRGN